jgi:F0F1-type ATP synthase membrane subunit b/b'
VMEERETNLAEARSQSSEASRITEEARQSAELAVVRARERADRLLRDAHEQADQMRRAALEQAGDEVGQLLEQGRARIAAARENEIAALRGEALECVGLACQKLVGEAESGLVESAVDKLLERRLQ